MKIGDVVIVLILFGLLGISLYFLYLNWPSEPKDLIERNDNYEPGINGSLYEDSPDISKQFYSNLRFPDKRISYHLENSCDEERRAQLIDAFGILEFRTILEFYPDSEEPEILITCSEIAPEPEQEGHFIAGEGGPTEIINTSLYAVAFAGKISLFRPEKCESPNIALHELLHVLGFDHNNNPKSILYPTLDCEQKIDDYFIEEINRLYAVPGNSDLRISEVKSSKAGRYLSFEIKVENQGLKDAISTDLDIVINGKSVNSFELGEISVGTTKILTVENMKISRSTEEVDFVVDKDNILSEIFEDNNNKVLVLGA